MDYLEIDGKELRVEFNFNALANFFDMSGRSLADLANFADIRPKEILQLIWCAVVEGERLEGRKVELTCEDLGAVMAAADITAAIEVLNRHFAGQTSGKEDKGGKEQKKRMRWFTKR